MGGFVVKCGQFSQEPGPRTGSEFGAKNDKATSPSGVNLTYVTIPKDRTTGRARMDGFTGNSLTCQGENNLS